MVFRPTYSCSSDKNAHFFEICVFMTKGSASSLLGAGLQTACATLPSSGGRRFYPRARASLQTPIVPLPATLACTPSAWCSPQSPCSERRPALSITCSASVCDSAGWVVELLPVRPDRPVNLTSCVLGYTSTRGRTPSFSLISAVISAVD